MSARITRRSLLEMAAAGGAAFAVAATAAMPGLALRDNQLEVAEMPNAELRPIPRSGDMRQASG